MYVCCMYALVCLRFVFTNGRSDAANAAASVQHGYRLGLDGASKVTQPLRKEASSNLGRRVKPRSVLHNFDVRRGAARGRPLQFWERLVISYSAHHNNLCTTFAWSLGRRNNSGGQSRVCICRFCTLLPLLSSGCVRD